MQQIQMQSIAMCWVELDIWCNIASTESLRRPNLHDSSSSIYSEYSRGNRLKFNFM